MSAGGSSRMPRVLVIGLDGATFDNIKPWVEEGKLPTFARLLDQGVHGALRSSVPPITAPAWTSFMTGKNPGKHGLYNFVEPQPGAYKIRYANAKSRVGQTLWQILSGSRVSVGSINVPMTYPPDEVDGYMISGLDAPEGSTSITHPPELYAELARQFDKVSKQIRYLGFLKTDERRDMVLRSLEEADDHYLRMTRYLMEARPVEVTMVVFTSTDTVQHFFYHYMDPQHPQYDAAGAAKYKDAIFKVHERMDGIIANLMSALDDDATVVLMSDHGFHAASGRVVHLNRFLESLGLLRRTRAKASPSRRLFKAVDTFLRESLSPEKKARLADTFPALRRKWESSYGGFADIDWKNTTAFCYEVLTFPPGIWINRKGVHPEGIVADGAEYDDVLRLITEKLHELKDPVTGKPLITRVYRKEEVYQGSQLAQAPDLSLAWWDGVSFVAKQSSDESAVVEYVGSRPLGAGEWSGVHAMDGIVTFYGKSFRRGLRLDNADIVDVTPTLLYLLGLPVPDDVDGRVLLEAFTEEHVARHGHPVPRDSSGGPSSERTDNTYSDEESDQVAERLRGLGYIE
jgi:predicted AlkP superfamily phosphohydrolase/phosphomutase